jgi:hypothetical protein
MSRLSNLCPNDKKTPKGYHSANFCVLIMLYHINYTPELLKGKVPRLAANRKPPFYRFMLSVCLPHLVNEVVHARGQL